MDISRLRKNRPINFKIGLILSLSLVILAFNISLVPVELEIVEIKLDEDPTVSLIQIPKEKPKTIKIPQPNIINAMDLDQDLEFEIEPDSKDVIETWNVNDLEAQVNLDSVEVITPPPLPPNKEVDEVNRTWTRVERMPQFGNCSALKLEMERMRCTESNLLKFIYSKIRYPKMAIENKISGKVLVGFVVNRNGEVQEMELIRDIGGGCGQEVIKVLQKMPEWTPGIQGGRAVNVQYRIPIDFRLE